MAKPVFPPPKKGGKKPPPAPKGKAMVCSKCGGKVMNGKCSECGKMY